MKLSLRFLFLPGALLVALSAQARIWRVNNNPGIDADYASPQAAHDATTTQPGDTLHLEASQTSYGSFTLAKRLVVIGPGYFLNQNPATQADPRSAFLDGVNVHPGAADAQIMGLEIGGVVYLSASNVLLQRNLLRSSLLFDITAPFANPIVTQNYIMGSIGHQSLNGAVSGIQISNNFIGGDVGLAVNLSGTFSHNIVSNANNFDVRGFVLRNNILIGSGSFQPNNNQFDHNMGPGFGTANGNQAYPGAAAVFVTTGSTDGRWQLKPAPNPARGAGAGGVDLGMYGGATPYRLSGVPAVPAITNLLVPNGGVSGAPLHVTISIQSNN